MPCSVGWASRSLSSFLTCGSMLKCLLFCQLFLGKIEVSLLHGCVCAVDIVSRLIPLTALITPATLSVDLLTTPNTTQIRVPTVDFAQRDFWLPCAVYEGMGRIGKPSSVISRLFTAVYSSVAFRPIWPSFPNSSYTLEFWGPSYICQNLSEVVAETKGMTFTDAFVHNYISRIRFEEELAERDKAPSIELNATKSRSTDVEGDSLRVINSNGLSRPVKACILDF